MVQINNMQLRNLTEQVQRNKDDIKYILTEGRQFDEFGIKVVGQVATVAELPEIATADPRTIYFVSRNSPYEDDMYDEYVLLGDKWEFLGNKDLTAYAKIGLLNEYQYTKLPNF